MGTELKKAVRREALNPQFPYMPREEWDVRIKRARELMEKKGIDAFMVLNNQNRLYFFGSGKPYKHAYPDVGIIPRQGPTTLISESGDAFVVDMEGYAEQNVGYRGDTQAPTPTAPDPVKLVAEMMEEIELGNKTIGMEFGTFMWWDGFTMNEWEQFKKELPKATFVDATDLIWEMRMIKSQWEIEVMRRLYWVTCKGYFEIIHNAKPGVNEKQLFYDALKIWIDEGIVDSTNYLLSVLNAIQPYRDRILEKGDWIMLDGGPSYKGYCADTQRIIHIGNPGLECLRAAHLAAEAFQAVEEILRPGISAGDVWMTAMGKVAEGDPDMWRKARSRRLVGWTGHGEGLNIHEPPYLVEGSKALIREGMVIAIEIPSFYGRNFANMPEDAYLITKDGFEKLTTDLGPDDVYVKT